MRTLFLSLLLTLTLVAGCDTGPGPGDESGPTYYQDVMPLLAEHCVSCHRAGQLAPFSLDTYESVVEHRAAIAASVASGSMPPWAPADDCTTYSNDRSLSPAAREVIVSWAGGASREGDAEASPEINLPGSLDPDLSLQLPSAYTPQQSPDDYRCMVVEWPEDELSYVTGFEVIPDETAIVHHVIAFSAGPNIADQYRALDEESPDVEGYPCFGGPGGSSTALINGMRWLASWAPGGGARVFPEGTGIPVDPGSVLIVQMHYNTLEVEPAADRSSVLLTLAESVDRPAAVLPFTSVSWVLGGGMAIPAGEPDVMHETSEDVAGEWLGTLAGGIGLSDGDSFEIHSAAHHMHLLGTQGRAWVEKSDGTSRCLLEIDDWDFNWQEAYSLEETVRVDAGDRMHLQCHWDNSAENQPIIDGELVAPEDVSWGDGTRDEMCLGVYYITGVD